MAWRTLLVPILTLAAGAMPGAAMASTWSCSLGYTVVGPSYAVEFRALETARPGDRLYAHGSPGGLQYTIVVNDPLTLMAEADTSFSGPDGKLKVYSETLSIKKTTGYIHDVVTTYGPGAATAAVRTARGFCRRGP